jgi:hypothetical protein
VARIRFAINLLGRHWRERIITKLCDNTDLLV